MFTLFAATIFIFFSLATLIPVIPQYVHSVLRQNDFAVGLVMSMQAIGAIGSRTIVGKIISAYGTRKTMLLGAVVETAGALSYFLPSGLLTLSLGRFLQGIGEGLVFTSGTTWMLNKAPDRSRGHYIALFGLALWLGGSISPPLGAFVTNHLGFKGAWAFAAVTSTIGAVILFYYTRQEHKPSHEKIRFEWIAKESIRPGITLALASAGYVGIATFSTLFFSSKGWANGSWPIAAFGLGYVVMRFFGGKLIDRIPIKTIVAYSSGLEAIGLLGMSFSLGPAMAIISAFATGSGLALMYPALAIAAVHGVSYYRQGTVIGWYSAFWDFSLFVYNLIFGWTACLMGYKAVFLGGLLSTLLSLLYIASWKNPVKQLSKEDKDFESM